MGIGESMMKNGCMMMVHGLALIFTCGLGLIITIPLHLIMLAPKKKE